MNKKIALITGSTRGIGRALAMGMARSGYSVIVNGTVRETVESVVQLIRQKGGEAAGIPCDICNPEAVQNMVDSVVRRFGRLDVLINNAGIVRDRMSYKMSIQEWHDVINVHLNGSFYCIQASLPYMKESGGSIINVVSSAGIEGCIGQANYAAAKAGLIGLTYTLAQELIRFGIRVNAVAPAALTDMTRPHVEKAQRQAKDRGEDIPDYWKIGNPEDLLPLLLYLSEPPEDVTGRLFSMNGSTWSIWNKPQIDRFYSKPNAGTWSAAEIARQVAELDRK
ncbi:SDR family NAD(P)-dependent oxidoreductase [Aneurinibacillus sp. Ricciae_BoGa-3]|uniref:SDR family NAD(P)-dependent oxidoreductase n=1 Tax=Aneurinibacillus sp. Ricciae_BoGa-3 TaxID=3022697 RepID=UPI00234137F2|nr:SDR family NAD(P)-dependent oxidoreductase [Aneurinibacillus sp. Ricciae_BoGa-3]WCK55332.1 SDR family NAD(P)-dependent oxidoreductase [Aneurinibacillus sp. Ricciae_BoGa-3]